jgi:hypothetical protein
MNFSLLRGGENGQFHSPTKYSTYKVDPGHGFFSHKRMHMHNRRVCILVIVASIFSKYCLSHTYVYVA